MQVDTDVEAIAGSQHGLFTAAQARDARATRSVVRHRLATGRWIRHRLGIYRIVGAPVTPQLEVLAATLSIRGSVVSHRSAASLVGLPGFALLPVSISVESTSVRHLPGVEVHRTGWLPSHHRVLVDGIPCTSVARTIFDGCATLHPRRAERALDNALARRLVTIAAVHRVLDDLAVRGRGGSALLRRLLDRRGARYVAPESELEARFLELVAGHGLPVPARQVDVGDADQWVGRVDFVFRQQRLIVEVDGRLTHSAHLDVVADAERDRQLTVSGWEVRRFTWDDVTRRPTRVAFELRARLAARSNPPTSVPRRLSVVRATTS